MVHLPLKRLVRPKCGALFCALLLSQATVSAKEINDTRRVTQVRFSEGEGVTRIAVETDGDIRFHSNHLPNPERIFFDLSDTKPALTNKGVTVIAVSDRLVRQIRVSQRPENSTRIVLDMLEQGDATSRLENPHRLIIELRPRVTHKKPRVFSPPPMSIDELERSKIRQSESLEPPPRTEDQFTLPLLAAYYTPPMTPPAYRSGTNTSESSSPVAIVEPSGSLRIAILEGDEAINNIKQRVSRPPIVEVQDQDRKPVGGAIVTFALPNSGPSAAFADGSRLLAMATNQAGRASIPSIRPNAMTGSFKINVTASFERQTAVATISQTNVLVGGAVKHSGLFGIGMRATVGVVAAVVVGTVVGVRKGMAGGAARKPPTTVSVGAPSLPSL